MILSIPLVWLLLFLLLPASHFDAFAPGSSSRLLQQRRPHQHLSSSCARRRPFLVVVLDAKKNRRRKKTTTPSSPPPAPVRSESSDLPDFDLNEDDDNAPAPVAEASSSSRKTISNEVISSSPDTGEITQAMMGSVDKPVRSVKELISDRSLESKFDFGAEEAAASSDEPLPDLLAMQGSAATESSSTSTAGGVGVGVGKKRARQDARRAAAIEKAENERDEEGFNLDFLAGIPFFPTTDDGRVTPLKLTEAVTWLCIILLVFWEIYINSPFFERAAPMAPVVFEFMP